MYTLNDLKSFIGQTNDRELILRQICLTADQVIPGANMVSLWVFDPGHTKIQNLIAYQNQTGSFSVLPDLHQQDFPEYFSAIIENELLVAPNARTHSMTQSLSTAYFEPNDIHSLLDFILHRDFQPIGVICCESKGKPARWTPEDEENLRALSILISYFFEL